MVSKDVITVITFFIVFTVFMSPFAYASHTERYEKITKGLLTKINSLPPDKNVRVIIKLKPQRGIQALTARGSVRNDIKATGGKIRREYSIFEGMAIEIPISAIEALSKNPNIEWINYDYRVRTFINESVPLINADKVWSEIQSDQNITGIGQTVCLIDTGVNYSHSFFGGGIGLNYTVIGGYDFVNNDTDPMDDYGHGTHVAGIIASTNSIYRGVAPGAKIIAIKALDQNGSGSESDVISGIDWCVSNATIYNISVISMSLGSPYYNSGTYCDSDFPEMAAAINSALANNISVVIATGNEGNYSGVSAPACIRNATRVTATTKTDKFASFANRGGDFNDILAAPGVEIWSADISGDNYIIPKSGTSMATPHVSGLIALLNQEYKALYGANPTPKYLLDIMNSTGKLIFDSETNKTYPRIDALAAYIAIDKIPPKITILSPPNDTIYESTLLLNVTFSEVVTTWYSIDLGSNSTLYKKVQNITLNLELSQGAHNITVYANDTAGNLNSSTVIFTLFYPIKNLNTSQNYTSIQAAIDNASTGDTILLSLGTYIENAVVNKSLNIVGELGAIVRAANSTLPIFNITAEYVNISGISFSGSNVGVLLSSGNSSISNCTFYSLNKSIYVANSSGNSIYNNTITNNTIGIYLQVSSNNTLYNNTLKENSYGIYLNSSYNNSIYHNNIINSTLLQAYDNGNNTWDSGYPSGGNFWSNWTSPDRNGDGVVDYPYPLGNNTDSYPVIQADGWLLIQPDTTPPSIHIESPDNGSYLNTSWVFVNVTINETAWLVRLEWNNGTANNYMMNEIACYGNNTCWVSNITATDGNYSFKIYAEDSVGLWNTSESRIIIIDTIRPHVENLTVTPLKPLVGSLTNITVNVSDLNLDSVWLNITLPNGTSLMYQMTLLGGAYYYNFTASSFGTYKAQIIANDSAGNVNNTVEITFWGVETFSNSSTLPNGTSKLVINESIIKINVSAAENASAKVELNITIAPESKTFNIPEISNSTSEADKGIKFLNISSNLTNVSSIKIQLYYTSNETEELLESSLSLYYWNGSKWVSTASYRNETIPGGPFVYDAGVNTDEDYVWAVVNHSSVYGIGGLIDSDGDGIADRDDACPTQAETVNGYQDSDGCPDSVPTVSGGGGGGGAAAKPRIVLLANSIDLNLSSGFFGFLRNQGIDIVYVNASNFSNYKTEKFIVILGGPDAPEGVGEVVREVLNESEQAELRTPGAKKMYVKANVWRSYNQVVMVIAGSGRDQTREAEEENKLLVRKKVKGS
jgi:parallel beta-helix repeat protein